jgi:spore coat polysaccharide biosynthesis protein SpsF
MRVVAISQARTGSSRLPGKVLLPILGRPLLAYHLERVSRAKLVDEVVVATTEGPDDDAIVTVCADLGVSVFRGSEDDVLGRYAGAAASYAADVVVRVTSDCPLIDPVIVDRTISQFVRMSPDVDYVSNRLVPSYPRGLDAEVLTRAALESAASEATNPEDREHVTLFVWRQPERFRLSNVRHPVNLSHHRWTVDEAADLDLMKKIISEVYPKHPNFSLQDCLDALAEHPHWAAINSDVEQQIPEIVRETYGRAI